MKRLLIATWLVFIFCITIVQITQEAVNAKEVRVIRVYGGDTYSSTESIRIEPQYISVSQGTVVVWSNWTIARKIKIVFEEGKTCQDVTGGVTGFNLDAESCFVTTWIPFGGTSSLRFTEKGLYKYVVEAHRGIKEKGEIRVH